MPGSNMWEMERRYSVAENDRGLPPPSLGMVPSTSEDLHAWSIYRQNLNSDFTDSALGSSEKSPLPYGNFQLRESTVQSILNHPRYGPKSALGSNMYTYLKFGLPRVFPPNGRGGKDTSSGYNSSDEGTRRRRASYLRARSEADIANLHYQPGISARGKSISQANLLSPDTLLRQAQASHRRSLHDLRHTDYIHPNVVQPSGMARPASVALPNRPPSIISGPNGHPNEPFTFSMLRPQQYTGLYPHLQIRNMNIRSSNGEALVNNLSMEVKAGEILSIMSTNGMVATALLDVIAGKRRYSGHISLNGQAVSGSELRRSVAYVRSDTVLHPHLAVHNCLRFYAKLRHPHKSRGKIPMHEQVRIVTEELGLTPVLDTKVSDLTRSEYSRLLVAIQLLADAQILCIDHITHTMDIFDTFFLVEFLRQWASGATGGVAGRIVVMALQPPTYEILTMVSRLLVLSGGETMYHGPARHITQYFTSAEYPCPAFKNPADYYLDLVTLDDLSAEAMLESSQRVDQLASLYRRRQQPLSEAQPYSLPTNFSTAGAFSQAYAILMKEVIYTQPSSFSKWISRVLIAALMSVIVGAIFWDIPTSDPHLHRHDRLGYHYAMMVTAAWPILLLVSFSKTHGVLREAAESDIQQNLYYRTLYIIFSLVFTLVPSSLIWLAYLVPAYCMSGLYDQSTADGLTVYLGYGVAHLISLQYLTMAVGYLVCSSRALSALIATLLYALMGASSGYPLHTSDLPYPAGLVALATPMGWLYTRLLAREHSKDTLASLNTHLVCRNKQVQRQDIIVQLPCPVPNGTAALSQHGLLLNSVHLATPVYLPPLAIVAGASLVSIIAFSVSPIFRKR